MSEKMSVEELVSLFEKSNITFAFAVLRDGQLHVSHEELKPFRDLISGSRSFDKHEAVFVGRHPSFKTLFFAFVHNTNRGLSQGGLRFKKYGDVAEVLWDGLRLSQGMSRKNAISGLWWGGGKGIIPITAELVRESFGGDEKMADAATRDALFAAYGEFVARLNGIYYTAADINTSPRDMRAVLGRNRFVTCIPRELGGSGDPSPYTAEGVFRAIKTARRHLTGSDDLSGVKIAVQGAGHVGKPLIENLVSARAIVFASEMRFETDETAREEFKREFPTVEIVRAGAGHENDILALDVEIIAPCAVGGTINKETIEHLSPSVKIICGGANNILNDEAEDGEILFREKGIVFIPDFACNWMGIVNCANEAFGYLKEEIEMSLDNVSPIVESILQTSDAQKISHTEAAHRLADEKIKQIPPLEILQEPLPELQPNGKRRLSRGQRLISEVIKKTATAPEAL
jgi:leucine dehydrogenase